MSNLEIIIGEPYATMIRQKTNIRNLRALFKVGLTPEGRRSLAETTGISEELILGWINLIDLLRIKGIGQEYVGLLERAGMNTLQKLQQADPESLYRQIINMNASKKVVRRLPTQAMVRAWVEQARDLPQMVIY